MSRALTIEHDAGPNSSRADDGLVGPGDQADAHVSARPSATPMNRNTMGSRPVFQKGTLLQ